MFRQSKNCYPASKNFGTLSKNFGSKNFGGKSKNCGSKNYCACMRVCMRVGAWVRSHFANISKIVQDAPGAGTTTQSRSEETQAPGRPPNTGIQATTTGAPEPERNHRSESATRASAPAGTRARAYKKKLQKQ